MFAGAGAVQQQCLVDAMVGQKTQNGLAVRQRIPGQQILHRLLQPDLVGVRGRIVFVPQQQQVIVLIGLYGKKIFAFVVEQRIKMAQNKRGNFT